MNLDDLKRAGQTGSDRRNDATPEAWRPRVEYDESGGFIVAPASRAGNMPGANEILAEHGLDPGEWVVTSVRKGKWQRWDGEWLESARVSVAPAGASVAPDFDLERLVDEVSKWRPGKGVKQSYGNSAYVHVGADKQLGKKVGGIGTEQTVARLLYASEASVYRFQTLSKFLNIGAVVLPEVGDTVEGNTSQSGRLQGQAASDLGQTEQVRVARRILMAQIKAFAPLAERVIVPVVGGNHDEVTRQVAADPADNWNVEVASAVQDACAENEALAHVEFRFPESGQNTLAVNVNGTMLGLFHGHQFRGDVTNFLKGQALGQQPLGGCDVYVSGHYHHYVTKDIAGDRVWFQAPTVDPGSNWFCERTGENSNPGVLTFVMGDVDPREWIGVIGVK